MPALGSWVTSIVTAASAAFAVPLLGVVALMSGIAFATGNRDAGKSIAVLGLLGVGIIMFITQIVASIPKGAGGI